jgi:hypothetical protein
MWFMHIHDYKNFCKKQKRFLTFHSVFIYCCGSTISTIV